jgi:diguanylate cyclase (GGDEF)-like protein
MLRLLEAVSHNAAMAIKNAEIFEITEKEAITDGLTGLYTIRYFQERLTEELNHAKRRKTGIALAMIDADNFKTLNDTLGHPEGDKCLKTLADIMRKFTRESDLVCRIGGDEFVIILKEIDKNNALLKAELVRQAVEATFKNSTVKITTSIGLACFPEDGDNKKDLIASADAALYKSKKLGRNRVSIATGPITSDFKMEPLPRE